MTIDPLPRGENDQVVLARADFRFDGKIDEWKCLDCGTVFRSLYGILRHLAYEGDRQVTVEILIGEIYRRNEP